MQMGHVLPLTRQSFVVEMWKALCSIGEDPQIYGGHSFRSGMVTVAAEQEIGNPKIKLFRPLAQLGLSKVHQDNSSQFGKLLTDTSQVNEDTPQPWRAVNRCSFIGLRSYS